MASNRQVDAITGDETFRWAAQISAPTGTDGATQTIDVTDTADVIVDAHIDQRDGTKVADFTVSREADGVLVFTAPDLSAYIGEALCYDARVEVVSLSETRVLRPRAKVIVNSIVTNL